MSMRMPPYGVPGGLETGVAHIRSPVPVVEHRRPAYLYDVDEARSRSDSRRSTSRRDGSPRSGHPYRSTPETKRSLANSISESDDETDTTFSSQDERDRRPRREEIPPIAPDPSRHDPSRHHHSTRGEAAYEESFERRSRYPPPVIAPVPVIKRSSSRHSSDRDAAYRRPRPDSRDTRHYGDVDESSRSPSRPARRQRYYESEMVYAKAPSGLRRSHTYTERVAPPTSDPSVGSSRRSSSFLENFFGSSLQTPGPTQAVKIVDCIVCMDEKPSHKTAKLKCGHRMCHSCLKRNFKLSLTDPQHMPPKCCTNDHIPLKHVDRLFDTTFKKTWNKKFAEYSTRNRIYCPSRRCGEWIKPEHISRDLDGRKYGKCSRCKTKVCYTCNSRWHRSLECPRDEETNQFLEQAKEEGWQRCHRCKAMVELKEGCNHMTCRCGAEFCMICGAKWKTCECPWFSYETVENDRLEHMQVPLHMHTERDSFRGGDTRFQHTNSTSPREFRSSNGPAPAAVRPRPQSYEEEMLLRQLQERRDEDLARRLQSYADLHDDEKERRDKYRLGEVVGPEHSAGRLMNEDYRRGPQAFVVPPASVHPSQPPSSHPSHGPVSSHPSNLTYPPHASYERGDSYVSGVNKARGVPRASSLERRLADRFNVDTRQVPPNGLPLKGSVRIVSSSSVPLSHGPLPGMPAPGPYAAEPIPVAPAPPPALSSGPPVVPISRRHTTEEEVYSIPRHSRERHSRRSRRERERDRERDRDRDREYIEEPEPEPEIRMPSLRRRHTTQAEEIPKDSVLAGLTGPGRGMNRVYEWRNYVAPGAPEADATTAMA